MKELVNALSSLETFRVLPKFGLMLLLLDVDWFEVSLMATLPKLSTLLIGFDPGPGEVTLKDVGKEIIIRKFHSNLRQNNTWNLNDTKQLR